MWATTRHRPGDAVSKTVFFRCSCGGVTVCLVVACCRLFCLGVLAAHTRARVRREHVKLVVVEELPDACADDVLVLSASDAYAGDHAGCVVEVAWGVCVGRGVEEDVLVAPLARCDEVAGGCCKESWRVGGDVGGAVLFFLAAVAFAASYDGARIVVVKHP